MKSIRLGIPLLTAVSMASSLTAQQTAPEWRLEPELRIGSVADGPYALGYIGNIVVSPTSGLVFIGQGNEIRAFTEDGEYVRTIGREGEGPGDFMSIAGLSWSDGSVIASDIRTRRVTRYSEDGTLLDSRLIEPSSTPERTIGAHPVGPLTGGNLLVTFSRDFRWVADGSLDRLPLVLTDGADFERIVDHLDYSGTAGTFIRPNQGPLWFARRQAAQSLHAIDPYGEAAVVVHQANPTTDEVSSFRVRKLAANGEVLFARNRFFTPRPLSQAVRDSVAEWWTEHLTTRAVPARREAERVVRDSLRLPRFHAPVTDVLLAVDGSVWLRREDHGGETVVWWILDRRGELAGGLRLPEDVRIAFVDGDIVWGVERDELDVSYAVRYRLRR